MASLPDTWQSSSNSDRPWQTSSLVPQAGSSSVLSANSQTFQPVPQYLHHTNAVEVSLHPTSPETSCPHAARWLPANLYHSSPHPHHGTNSRPALPLSSLPLSSTKPVVHRPVRFPSDWISNSCNNLSSQHRHQPSSNQPLRHRHIPGLQQGVWHSATLHPDGEVSPASPSRLRLQLAGWLLHRAFALYCLPWSSVDAEVHRCQHYPGLRYRTRRHRPMWSTRLREWSEGWRRWLLATNCASSPTTSTSSSQPATSTRGRPR